jgi:large subunit ribosomal protein L9
MKIILTEKINRLGNIGDAVDVATGYARNYLLPNGKALRWSRENISLFEAKKADIIARHETAKKSAESNRKAVEDAKFHMIRQAGDTGHLYGSVSSRDIARLLKDLTGVMVESAQVLMGSPIKTIGSFETKIALHPDVIVPVKIFVAQTQDEIDALVAGKVLTFGVKKVEEEIDNREQSTEHGDSEKGAKSAKEIKSSDDSVTEIAESESAEKKPVRKPRAKKVNTESKEEKIEAAE